MENAEAFDGFIWLMTVKFSNYFHFNKSVLKLSVMRLLQPVPIDCFQSNSCSYATVPSAYQTLLFFRAGLLNYFKKGSSDNCQNFSRSGHSHKIMQMWHVLDFSNKNVIWEFNTIILYIDNGYTKSGKSIQILTNVVSVIYCSAGGNNGILCFLAVT